MTEPGSTTAEIRAIPTTTPARPAGRRALIGGLVLGAITYLASLTAAIVAEQGLFNALPAQLFGFLSAITLACLSAGLIIAGHNARQQQKQLAPFHQAIAEQKQLTHANRLLLERLTLDTHERYDNLIMIVAAVPGRINATDEDLAGVKEQLAAMGLALDAIAKHLPDALHHQNWLGYARSERDHETQRTGTDGNIRRPPYIKSVPNEQP